MPGPRNKTSLVAVLAIGVVGYLLLSFGPTTLTQFNTLREQNPTLGYVYLGSVIAGALLVGGLILGAAWRVWGNTLARRRGDARRGKNPSQLSRGEQGAELADNLAAGRDFAASLGFGSAQRLRAEIERAAADLEAKQDASHLEIVAFGTISSGKSSLLNALAGRDVFRSNVVGGTTITRGSVPWPAFSSGRGDRVTLVDTPGLAEVAGESRAAEAAAAAEAADLVLFVVDGPLKSYEEELLTLLGTMEKRVVLCLNKEDWYDRVQQEQLLGQLREQSAGAVRGEDVVAVRSRPAVRDQVRVAADGAEETVEVTDPPDISPLADRLVEIVRDEGGDLLLANLLLRSRGLVDDAKERVLSALDDEADRVVNRYMWAAGGAGAAPLPVVDIAAGGAVTVKMVLDLAGVYKQKIDADTVVEMLSQLGKNLIAMLGVSAAAPLVSAGVGQLLKTSVVGALPGSLLQGVTQALMTRWIGRVFCRYYREGMKPPEGGLAELAKQEWDLVTSADELRKLVRLGREKLADRK